VFRHDIHCFHSLLLLLSEIVLDHENNVENGVEKISMSEERERENEKENRHRDQEEDDGVDGHVLECGIDSFHHTRTNKE
jgi:hypothetical protein